MGYHKSKTLSAMLACLRFSEQRLIANAWMSPMTGCMPPERGLQYVPQGLQSVMHDWFESVLIDFAFERSLVTSNQWAKRGCNHDAQSR